MANKIIMKKSSVAAKIPLATDLEVGEIAGNLEDQKLYSKKPDGTVVLMGQGLGGSGDVEGPSSATDNAVARYDGTTGKAIQNSDVTVDDSGNLTATTIRATGTGANIMPVGSTAQRPASPQSGEYRLNSTTGEPEWYDVVSGEWLRFRQTPSAYEIEHLVIAGGGGGGRAEESGGSGASGGGGAGGVSVGTTSLTIGTTYTVTVGAGGAGGGVSQRGASGSNSVFGPITSIGGGGGGTGGNSSLRNGLSGGSGGGGGIFLNTQGLGGSSTSGQGNAGGNSATEGNNSGGGGGAGAAGGVPTSIGGVGGNGLSNSITGSAVTRAGGGGGAGYNNTGGAGGTGGGGAGGTNAGAAGNGSANLGGGGGGAGMDASGVSGPSGSGGSGVVIISVPTANYSGTTTGSPTVTTSGANTVIQWTSSGSYTA